MKENSSHTFEINSSLPSREGYINPKNAWNLRSVFPKNIFADCQVMAISLNVVRIFFKYYVKVPLTVLVLSQNKMIRYFISSIT